MATRRRGLGGVGGPRPAGVASRYMLKSQGACYLYFLRVRRMAEGALSQRTKYLRYSKVVMSVMAGRIKQNDVCR